MALHFHKSTLSMRPSLLFFGFCLAFSLNAQFCSTSAITAEPANWKLSTDPPTEIPATTASHQIGDSYLSFGGAITLGYEWDEPVLAPTLSGSWGKYVSPRWTLGAGASLLTFQEITLPIFVEGTFAFRPTGVSVLLRNRVGYNTTTRLRNRNTDWWWGPTNERYRGGLFHQHEVGMRLPMRRGVQLQPTVGYTFANSKLFRERGSQWREETSIRHRRLTFGLSVVF